MKIAETRIRGALPGQGTGTRASRARRSENHMYIGGGVVALIIIILLLILIF